MSDYRRFISYLYEYRQGAKGENRGFVRVESRNGSCTLEIHMKLPALSAGVKMCTYGFVRQDSSLEGIQFHQSFTGNGFFDARFATETNHMGNSPYTLEQLGGLLIFSENGHCYGTAWDETPIKIEQFTSAASSEDDTPGKNSMTAALASGLSENTSKKPFVPVPEEEPLNQIFIPVPEEEPLNQTFIPVPEEESAAQAFIPAPEEEPVTHSFIPIPEEAPADPTPEENLRKTFVPVPEEEQITQASVNVSEKNPRNTTASQEIPGPHDWCADPRWFQVQKRYPSMHPFPDDTICECVKLDLKDLPSLRRDGWMLGSNRFVLHGYYSHRHLLMGRLCGRDGCCYILGIPGFYDRQEQFMANSFGFPCFHAASLQNTPGRTFGYWYRPIS